MMKILDDELAQRGADLCEELLNITKLAGQRARIAGAGEQDTRRILYAAMAAYIDAMRKVIGFDLDMLQMGFDFADHIKKKYKL